LTDRVVGGWYDAGDTLKVNFPMASAASFLAWGLLEFGDGYAAAGHTARAKETLRVAVDYLRDCHISPFEYIGQIGDPGEDRVVGTITNPPRVALILHGSPAHRSWTLPYCRHRSQPLGPPLAAAGRHVAPRLHLEQLHPPGRPAGRRVGGAGGRVAGLRR
jgi:hypothetical protein